MNQSTGKRPIARLVLDDEIVKRLDELAKEEGESVSLIARRIFRAHLFGRMPAVFHPLPSPSPVPELV